MNEPPTSGLQPTGLTQDGPDVLVIDWDDGLQQRLAVRDLRLACRCAECVDEWTSEPLLDPESVAPGVRPLRIEPVGRYGIQVHWSDGHSTGITTFDTLRSLARPG